jgi:DAPG hydrolase PhiG domain
MQANQSLAPGKYLGRTHLAHEYIGSHLYKLKIHFRDPGEILDKRRFAQAKVGTAIYGYVGSDRGEWLVRQCGY